MLTETCRHWWGLSAHCSALSGVDRLLFGKFLHIHPTGFLIRDSDHELLLESTRLLFLELGSGEVQRRAGGIFRWETAQSVVDLVFGFDLRLCV